ncbi:MAG: dethiobiotin synthase [Halioglobus sp.]
MSKTWFVTGTDTDVGKTAISCALIAAANARGLRTAAVKPVAAGCDEMGRNSDALLLQAMMSEPLPYEQVNPVALRSAIAPHLAAQQEGKRIEASRLAGFCRGVMMGPADFVLIEGAGGWRVPINSRETLAQLAVELQVDVILVVAMRLGCINHALMTAEAIARDGLKLAGWVANSPAERMDSYEGNLATLQRWLPAPLIGEVDYMTPYNPELAAKSLSLQPIIG